MMMINKKILFVDDEKAILSSLRRELRKTDYDILTAASGEEALEKIHHFSPHILVTDERMPDMGGIQLLQLVKERYPRIVRIMLSGYASPDSIIQAVNKGEVFRFLTKPWNREDLMDCLEGGFRRYEVMQETTELMEPILSKGAPGETDREGKNRPLEISQTLLNALCLPVLVVDWEDSLGLINQAGKEFFLNNLQEEPSLTGLLGEEITERVKKKLTTPGGIECESISFKGSAFTLYIRALRSGDPFKGVLILEKHESGENE